MNPMFQRAFLQQMQNRFVPQQSNFGGNSQPIQGGIAPQLPTPQGGISPQGEQQLQQQQEEALRQIQQMYQAMQPQVVQTPSPFEQALQMAGQGLGRGISPLLGNIQQGLQGALPGIGTLLGSLAHQGAVGGFGAGAEVGQSVPRPRVQRTMTPQSFGGVSTGPSQFNLVRPSGQVIGGGGFSSSAPQAGGEAPGQLNPFLQMLHQRGLMQPFQQRMLPGVMEGARAGAAQGAISKGMRTRQPIE